MPRYQVTRVELRNNRMMPCFKNYPNWQQIKPKLDSDEIKSKQQKNEWTTRIISGWINGPFKRRWPASHDSRRAIGFPHKRRSLRCFWSLSKRDPNWLAMFHHQEFVWYAFFKQVPYMISPFVSSCTISGYSKIFYLTRTLTQFFIRHWLTRLQGWRKFLKF